jgi:hypothetical protein
MRTKEIEKFMKYKKVDELCSDGSREVPEIIIAGQIIDTGIADIVGWSTMIKTSMGYFTVPNKSIRDIMV